MPRVGLLLHVLESRLIFMMVAAIIGKRMPIRSVRWLADCALQGIIFGCTGMCMSYAMLPAWELCLGWLATRLAWQLVHMLVVLVLWQMGVLVLGGWLVDMAKDAFWAAMGSGGATKGDSGKDKRAKGNAGKSGAVGKNGEALEKGEGGWEGWDGVEGRLVIHLHEEKTK